MDIFRYLSPTVMAWMRPALTGIIGLTIFALLRYGGGNDNAVNNNRALNGDRDHQRQTTQANASHGSKQGPIIKRDNPIAQAITASLPSINRLVISLTTALMQPGSSSSSIGSSLDANVAEVIRELCYLVPEVYLVSQISTDQEAEAITAALTSTHLLSLSPQSTRQGNIGSVPSQRLLLCSKAEGKVAIVRQLEPDLYIDSDQAAVAELARFLPRVWSIGGPGAASSSQVKAEIRSASTLSAHFKL
jgi:hypothetical protein